MDITVVPGGKPAWPSIARARGAVMRLRPSPNWLLLFVPVSVLLEHSDGFPRLGVLRCRPRHRARRPPDRAGHRAHRRADRLRGRRAPQRHLRQSPRADHRHGGVAVRPAGDGPGFDHRRDPGQPPDGAGRGTPGGGRAVPQPGVQRPGGPGLQLDDAPGRHQPGGSGRLRAGVLRRRARSPRCTPSTSAWP